MFRYCAYWRTWSRVIEFAKYRIVEVNLTPMPNVFGSTWEKDVAPIVIRKHLTLNRDDKVYANLPADIIRQMLENLGDEIVNRLLTEDFLPRIDWQKYERVCNGGAKFADIVI